MGVIIVFRLSKSPLKKETVTGTWTEPGTPTETRTGNWRRRRLYRGT